MPREVNLFSNRASGQVHFSLHLPELVSWFSEHQTFLFKKRVAQNTQKYANNAIKNGFQTLNPWLIIYAILAYVITYFGQAINYVGQVKIIYYLPGVGSLFWNMLVPVLVSDTSEGNFGNEYTFARCLNVNFWLGTVEYVTLSCITNWALT